MDGTKIMKTFNGLEIYDEAAREQAVGVTTTGTGAAYLATVKTIDSLAVGVTFIMVPHTISTTTAPTIDVNGLGAKRIRLRLSTSPNTTIALTNEEFLQSGLPVRLTYDGTQWVIDDMTQPNANGLYGAVPIASGGTGGKTVSEARKNLGLGETDGALPIANGGTGCTTASEARKALGLADDITGAVPISAGGTGAMTASAALENLGIKLGTDAAPPTGAAGSLYFQLL